MPRLWLPVGGIMGVIGAMLLFSTLVNALLHQSEVTVWGHKAYSEWYFAWSALFLFFALTLILMSLHWTDPRVVFVLSGILAVLWYVFIVLGWSP